MSIEITANHPQHGEVTISVTHYQPDTTQEREDGCPMEIEYECSHEVTDTWAEQVFLEVMENEYDPY